MTFQEERFIARKFGVSHRAKQIIIRKIARIKKIGVTKMRGSFFEISFQAKFLQKATKSQEFRRNLLALHLHNTIEDLFNGPDGEQDTTDNWWDVVNCPPR